MLVYADTIAAAPPCRYAMFTLCCCYADVTHLRAQRLLPPLYVTYAAHSHAARHTPPLRHDTLCLPLAVAATRYYAFIDAASVVATPVRCRALLPLLVRQRLMANRMDAADDILPPLCAQRLTPRR